MLHLGTHRICELLQPRFKRFDISPLQYVILLLAETAGEGSLAEAELHHLLRAHPRETVPDSIQLVDRGLLQRYSSPTPPHCVSFKITDAGSAVLGVLDPLVREVHEALKSDFTDEEWELGLRFLRRLSGMETAIADGSGVPALEFLGGNRTSLPFMNWLDRG